MASKVNPNRRPTNVTLDARAVDDARALGINVSKACELGLVSEIKRAREARWRAENRAAIDSHNAFVEKHGIPLSRFRQF
ncbi:type II toxin-antitoxin system CcdA family antitoxin [Sphingomonas sp. SUN039]|uniref:type II toxin-antitoxin system CcdA family antitoxin n=1 Tax=Sphingomonas sp. SUN039 TaxID=2937787 RepID=UPI0021649885|nr:type II toxin-antitoxin system CcdA family antitoxin [Sphingomonas sp. SUN039]UVO55094.1 type II toxin-antitoxin system CcdA family antitoxin [Sphingomonas sp. SUN039]